MKGGVYLDLEAPLVREYWALVATKPGRRQRFPETIVELMASEEEARQRATEDRPAALLMGPSRSSEGIRLYYLVRWL